MLWTTRFKTWESDFDLAATWNFFPHIQGMLPDFMSNPSPTILPTVGDSSSRSPCQATFGFALKSRKNSNMATQKRSRAFLFCAASWRHPHARVCWGQQTTPWQKHRILTLSTRQCLANSCSSRASTSFFGENPCRQVHMLWIRM